MQNYLPDQQNNTTSGDNEKTRSTIERRTPTPVDIDVVTSNSIADEVSSSIAANLQEPSTTVADESVESTAGDSSTPEAASSIDTTNAIPEENAN